MNDYSISLEISSSTAMWTRPDTGDAPVSYPAPTYAAVKGIFESILWLQQAEIMPVKVEICRPIVFHSYTTNYGGPLRKSRIMKVGASYQLIATVLVNVCYRLYADVYHDPTGDRIEPSTDKNPTRATNGAHAFKNIFERRLQRGQCFSIPCLGWSEFVPDYVGVFRLQTSVCEEITLEIPSMYKNCFLSGKRSAWAPFFYQNIKIEKGVLRYAQ